MSTGSILFAAISDCADVSKRIDHSLRKGVARSKFLFPPRSPHGEKTQRAVYVDFERLLNRDSIFAGPKFRGIPADNVDGRFPLSAELPTLQALPRFRRGNGPDVHTPPTPISRTPCWPSAGSLTNIRPSTIPEPGTGVLQNGSRAFQGLRRRLCIETGPAYPGEPARLNSTRVSAALMVARRYPRWGLRLHA